MDDARIAALVAVARNVALRAYAPASSFSVGAAVLALDGRVFCGCNVENASYGLSICAERAAVFRMVAEGAQRIAGVAIWTPLAEPGSPCGACRQVLAEFAGPECPVFLAGTSDVLVRTTLGALLPRPFTFLDLERGGA
ncbi:MAG: cytidine deaminase [Planctomycetes bacterium]|nr:cytidine deaminase [Planctomycetota bacterium]